MKSPCLTALLLLSFSLSLSAQVKSDRSENDDQLAKAFVLSFFTNYRSGRDITPLIPRFFVKDFERRLKLCRTTSRCEGTARDFWKENAQLARLQPTQTDYLRHYAAVINVMYFYFSSVNLLAKKADKPAEDYEETAMTMISDRLRSVRRSDSKTVLEEVFDDGGDNALGDHKSLDGFRERIRRLETLAGALKRVETGARNELEKMGKTAFPRLRVQDFEVRDETNSGLFFDYPVGTRMLSVQSERFDPPLRVDLIREKRTFKIVAIYPPMD